MPRPSFPAAHLLPAVSSEHINKWGFQRLRPPSTFASSFVSHGCLLSLLRHAANHGLFPKPQRRAKPRLDAYTRLHDRFSSAKREARLYSYHCFNVLCRRTFVEAQTFGKPPYAFHRQATCTIPQTYTVAALTTCMPCVR